MEDTKHQKNYFEKRNFYNFKDLCNIIFNFVKKFSIKKLFLFHNLIFCFDLWGPYIYLNVKYAIISFFDLRIFSTMNEARWSIQIFLCKKSVCKQEILSSPLIITFFRQITERFCFKTHKYGHIFFCSLEWYGNIYFGWLNKLRISTNCVIHTFV